MGLVIKIFSYDPLYTLPLMTAKRQKINCDRTHGNPHRRTDNKKPRRINNMPDDRPQCHTAHECNNHNWEKHFLAIV